MKVQTNASSDEMKVQTNLSSDDGDEEDEEDNTSSSKEDTHDLEVVYDEPSPSKNKAFVVQNSDDIAVSGVGWWEELECGSADTFLSAESMDAAVSAAAVVCHAIDAVLNQDTSGLHPSAPYKQVDHSSPDGKDKNEESSQVIIRNAFCCIRPPGHHAGRFGNTVGCPQNGFCLLNNVAIGVMYARVVHGMKRCAVVDIDAHYGNGTAEIFENDPDSFYASIHLQGEKSKYFFPSSPCCTMGMERRDPNVVLANVYPCVRAYNPLAKKAVRRGRLGFRNALEVVILPALRAFRPDILFISAGFDGSSSDPIGHQMGLRAEDFHWAATLLRREADMLCHGNLIAVLEGGYDVSRHPNGLANCVEAFVCGLADLPPN